MKTLTHNDLYEQCRPLVIGDAVRLRQAASIVGAALQVKSLTREQAGEALFIPAVVDCLDLMLIPDDMPWGKLSPVQAMQRSDTSKSPPNLPCPGRCRPFARLRSIKKRSTPVDTTIPATPNCSLRSPAQKKSR
jgi:4-hydroxythreonine-4-phosphate dehydrogenase